MRDKHSEKDSHWNDKDHLNDRALFRTTTEPATLNINHIEGRDEGEYRCRVDFAKSPTRNSRIHLTVIGQYQKQYHWNVYKIKYVKLTTNPVTVMLVFQLRTQKNFDTSSGFHMFSGHFHSLLRFSVLSSRYFLKKIHIIVPESLNVFFWELFTLDEHGVRFVLRRFNEPSFVRSPYLE